MCLQVTWLLMEILMSFSNDLVVGGNIDESSSDSVIKGNVDESLSDLVVVGNN